MKAVVEYNRQRDSFQVIDKEHGVIPVDFDTEAEAWDFVLDCESEERPKRKDTRKEVSMWQRSMKRTPDTT